MEFVITQAIFLVIYAVAILLPVGLILRRVGSSPWWAVIGIIPIGLAFVLWWLAKADWAPAEQA